MRKRACSLARLKVTQILQKSVARRRKPAAVASAESRLGENVRLRLVARLAPLAKEISTGAQAETGRRAESGSQAGRGALRVLANAGGAKSLLVATALRREDKAKRRPVALL